MNKKEMILSASAAAAMVMVALPAAALSVSGSSAASVDTDGGLGARVDHVINATLGGTASTGVSVTANGSANEGSDSSAMSAGLGVNADVSGDTRAPIMVTRADVEGNTVTSASADASTVLNDADLSDFIAAQIKADGNVNSIQSTQDSVAMSYRVPAKFLGFIPMNVDATAVVNADGTVSVTYPWYSFLLATNGDLNARINGAVQNVLGARANGSLSGSVTATTTGNAMQSGNASATGTAAAQANAQSSAHASAQALANAATRAKLIADIRAAMAVEAHASGSVSADQ